MRRKNIRLNLDIKFTVINIHDHWILLLVVKLLYNQKCPPVRQPRLGENVIFSAPI